MSSATVAAQRTTCLFTVPLSCISLSPLANRASAVTVAGPMARGESICTGLHLDVLLGRGFQATFGAGGVVDVFGVILVESTAMILWQSPSHANRTIPRPYSSLG